MTYPITADRDAWRGATPSDLLCSLSSSEFANLASGDDGETFLNTLVAALGASKAREDALVEALVGVRAWAASLTVCDMNEIVADNGITAGMVVGQEAGEQVRRIDRILAALKRGMEMRPPLTREMVREALFGAFKVADPSADYKMDWADIGPHFESDKGTPFIDALHAALTKEQS